MYRTDYNRIQSKIRLLPVHNVVQGNFWMACPSQGSPPLRGAGLVQLLVRFWKPRPQRLLHGDHSVQVDQPPFTEETHISHFTLHMSGFSLNMFFRKVLQWWKWPCKIKKKKLTIYSAHTIFLYLKWTNICYSVLFYLNSPNWWHNFMALYILKTDPIHSKYNINQNIPADRSIYIFYHD